MANVSNVIKSIQDTMWKDAGVDGDAQRLAQLGWIFFLKIFDDRESQLEVMEDNYKSPLAKSLRWRNWAADAEGITGDELLDFVNLTLIPKLKTLSGSDPIAVLIRSTFDGANNYMKNGTLLRQVINKINEINFNATDDRHFFGDIYEQLLNELQSAGKAGEFYTPRAVTQFIVEQVNPRIGEKVMDPACGTGGFLTCAIEHLKKQSKKPKDVRTIQDTIHGIEKKHLPHVLCMTNLMLHGIDVPYNVRHDNTLSRPLKDWSSKEQVDVIVMNPPFGGTEEDGIEANFPGEFRTRETADLFLVLLMRLLKNGGRAGIVLPDGTLFGDGVKTRIKEALLTECNLHTIVRLPKHVFSPYTDIRTNLLFLTKGTPTKEIWFYEHPYPVGAKSYNKGRPISIDEFEAERTWWGSEKDGFKGRTETDRAWRISIEDIKAGGYNLDLKNPRKRQTALGDAGQLLSQQNELIEKTSATLRALKENLLPCVEMNQEGTEKLNTLFGNLGLIAGKNEIVSKLRELILKFALQGRLTDTRSSDEPVDLFLKRIWGSKEDERSEITGTPKPSPFEIPAHWRWVFLSEITKFSLGKTPPREDSRYWHPEDHCWVSIADMKHYQTITQTKEKVSELAANDIFKHRFAPAGSVLMSFKLTIGKVARAGIPCLHNEAIISMKPPESDLADFLFRFLPLFAPLQTSNNAIKGSTLNKGLLTLLPIALPPIQEQKRIVAKVNDLMVFCDQLEIQLEASQANGDKLLEAMLSELAAS